MCYRCLKTISPAGLGNALPYTCSMLSGNAGGVSYDNNTQLQCLVRAGASFIKSSDCDLCLYPRSPTTASINACLDKTNKAAGGGAAATEKGAGH